MKILKEENNSDLLKLVCQLRSRTVLCPETKEMRCDYIRAKSEMRKRLRELLRALKLAKGYIRWSNRGVCMQTIDEAIRKAE